MKNARTYLKFSRSDRGLQIVFIMLVLSVFFSYGCSASPPVESTPSHINFETEINLQQTEESVPETALEPTDAVESSKETTPKNTVVEAGKNINPLTGMPNMDPENSDKRSVAIVVNNHYSSLPQRGLHRADVIYEYETEGGQTRLLALFADVSTVPEIGSIRSARILACDLAAGTNSIFVHFGANFRVPDHLKNHKIDAVDGNVMCASSGKSVNGTINLSGNSFFYRDSKWLSERAIEHTAVTNGALLKDAIAYKNIPLEGETPFLFKFVTHASSALSDGSACTDLNVFFSTTNKDSNFVYDPDVLMYTKYQYGGKPQIDEITGEMIYVKNVFVLFADIKPHGDSTIDAYLEKGGSGYYISEGKIIDITWQKHNPNSQIELFDINGDALFVNAGRSYINIVRETRSTSTTWQ